ncbi:hypothetical protein [Marinobacter changyiensis]|uniref:hypothetical protein n=1 Tax=Marinobacter changyiensis TaxID=2604091 RepID=UPI001C551071
MIWWSTCGFARRLHYIPERLGPELWYPLVKRPIIYGDVYQEKPITLHWAKYAQSLSLRPVKGMLTGSTTMIAWASVREDLATPVMADQIALALRDEIAPQNRRQPSN